jgi:nucleoside-triphosphatase THEP1
MIILSGPIQTGKTTTLINWCNSIENIYGIVTPVIDNKRMFMNVHGKEMFAMEAADNDEVFAVGRFTFSRKSFEKAIHYIKEAIDKDGWLVIDEIGPLELRGEGFDTILREVIAKRQQPTLIVVRETAVEKVKETYGITGRVITTDQLIEMK